MQKRPDLSIVPEINALRPLQAIIHARRLDRDRCRHTQVNRQRCQDMDPDPGLHFRPDHTEGPFIKGVVGPGQPDDLDNGLAIGPVSAEIDHTRLRMPLGCDERERSFIRMQQEHTARNRPSGCHGIEKHNLSGF